MALNVLILAVLLTVGFVGTRFASYLRIPHSVFLVFLGATLGLVLHGSGAGSASYVGTVIHTFPDLVLYVLLPPLVFDSSYRIDIRELSEDAFALASLAVGALVVSTLLIGVSLHAFLGLELLPSLTFGALISATDPVAVVALFKEVGAPKRLQLLVEGESLLNDGTAIVLYRLLLGLWLAASLGHGSSVSLVQTAGQFLVVVAAGIATGVAVGWLSEVLLRLVSHAGPAQLGLTFTSAYLSFIVAEHFLHASGVIATMAAGLYLGNRAQVELNREAAAGMDTLWEFLSLTANTLVFFVVGLTARPGALVTPLRYIPLTLLFVYAARAISVYGTLPLVNRLRVGRPISLAFQTVLFWGGLRGGLALGLVLTLPEAFPHRDLFLSLALAVVFATLFVNAITAKKVLELLRLNQLTERERLFQQRVFAVLGESLFGESGGAEGVKSLYRQLAPRPDSATDEVAQEANFVFDVTALLLRERTSYEEMLREGFVSREAYRELDHGVRLRLDLLESEGAPGSDGNLARFSFEISGRRSWLAARRIGRGGRGVNRLVERLTTRLEILQGLRRALSSSEELRVGPAAASLRAGWERRAEEALEAFSRAYPPYETAIRSITRSRALGVRGENLLDRFFSVGLINRAVYSDSLRKLGDISVATMGQAQALLRPARLSLLLRVPFFRPFPEEALRRLAEVARSRVFEPGAVIVTAGEACEAGFVVVAGILEGQSRTGGAPMRLFAGDAFGLEGLASGGECGATVRAEVPTEVLRLERTDLLRVMGEFPTTTDP